MAHKAKEVSKGDAELLQKAVSVSIKTACNKASFQLTLGTVVLHVRSSYDG